MSGKGYEGEVRNYQKYQLYNFYETKLIFSGIVDWIFDSHHNIEL